eukprot:XP_016664361.1 PREDICTED: uncharacterized protein LOC107885270 [Acyrthosiphon pisum]
MSKRSHESKGTSIIKQWLEVKKRKTVSSSKETKNVENTVVTNARNNFRGNSPGRGNDNETEINESQISGFENVGNGEYGPEPERGGSPFGFLRDFISGAGQSVLSPSHAVDYFNFVPVESYGDCDEPQAVDGEENSTDMGNEYDYGTNDYDDTVSTYEEVYDDVIERLGRSMASKFVSGIHRYVSRVIVPSGIDGVEKCLRELEQLIDKYPPRHFYIVAGHGDHVHISHICGYSGQTCRCPFILRGSFWSKDGRRGLRRVTRAIDMQPGDYANILRYLSTGGRRVHIVGGFREDVRLFDRYQYLSAQRYMGQAEGGLLAWSHSEVSWDVPCKSPGRDLRVENSDTAWDKK